MTTFVLPTWTGFERPAAIEPVEEERLVRVDQRVAAAAREGLTRRPKRLPPWLFYDRTGSRLFDEITERPEYYLTRTESSILAAHAGEMVARAAGECRLRMLELGAGSAGKTRMLLRAALERQGTVEYEPLDVSASALDLARRGIERDMPGVTVLPRVTDYTDEDAQGFGRLLGSAHFTPAGIDFGLPVAGERRMVLYIGSSMGNFEPREARKLLRRVRAGLSKGDSLLLGVDLVKDRKVLLAAYDDFACVTADFNLNMLERLNRELNAEFPLDSFEHRAVWNEAESRIEMHLASRIAQRVSLGVLGFEVEFAEGETIHTESSYKYAPGQPETMLREAGFTQVERWTDERGWFAVCLGVAE